MPNLQHWLIGQGLALFILVIFGLVVKLILEHKLKRTVSVAGFFIPLLMGFVFAFIAQYLLLFGVQ